MELGDGRAISATISDQQVQDLGSVTVSEFGKRWVLVKGVASLDVMERMQRITDEEKAFLQKIIDEHAVSAEKEDELDYKLGSLKRTGINSATQIALRFMGQSRNMPVTRLKQLLQATDTLRTNGAIETATKIEELINLDDIDSAMRLAKNYVPDLNPNRKPPKPKPVAVPGQPVLSNTRVLVGCRTPFANVRHILGTQIGRAHV